jgi:signal transduction histidine kinase
MSPESMRQQPAWYRSLYWRIALGLIAFLALMLAAQAGLFLWMAEQMAGSMPARSPRRLAIIVASDVSAALHANPEQDLQAYVSEQFGHVLQPFVLVMRDGRTASNHDVVPDELREAVNVERERLDRFSDPNWRPGRGFGAPDRPGAIVRALPPERPWESAIVRLDGEPVGVVSVLAGPSFRLLLRTMGPTLALVGGAVLIVGATLIALIVFGPARRRLKDVQLAAERLAAGDLNARAPERGGDEVAAVAHSFNEMADELAARAKALEEADRARRQLLADVSHELLTPLTAMRGYLDTLAMPELSLDAATRERYLSIVNDETLRLERIVGDLLDLARLEGGGTRLREERVSIAAIFDRVRARHERAAEAQRIRIVTDIEPDAAYVSGDPDRLEQAVQNLAANALRHTPSGGEIRLEARVHGKELHIRVRDTGPGIPEEHLPLIFERFYKADTSRKAMGGSGLGLSIVKAIVERHGGKVTAFNDGGAVFDISLPAASPLEARGAA